MTLDTGDDIGAHVSNAGGVHNAPARAAQLGASVFQLFTKQAARWAEPVLTEDVVAAFIAASHAAGIRIRSAHDSYLINLASPDDALRTRSLGSFIAELQRCALLGWVCAWQLWKGKTVLAALPQTPWSISGIRCITRKAIIRLLRD